MTGETVGVVRPTTTEGSFGDDALTYGTTPTHEVAGVMVEPRSSGEDNAGRQAVIVGLTLYLPTGSDVLPTDHLLVRGELYEAEGPPADWRNPFVPGHGGLVQAVKRVAG